MPRHDPCDIRLREILISFHWERRMENYTHGLEVLRRLVGEETAHSVTDRFKKLSPAFEQEAVAVVFGRTWSRDRWRI